MGAGRGLDDERGGTGPENLDLVELDQPQDLVAPGQRPATRRSRPGFRPPQGPAGMEPAFFDGQGGYRNTDKGPGTDQHMDVGVPAPMLASDRRPRMPRPPETMPGEMMERDPLEEGQTVRSPGGGGWQEFNDMQQR